MVDVLGTQLGRYEIRERIGRGGMASVYKARDVTLERWVAVKVLHDFLAEDPDFKTRFEREAKLVASLNHPNIVQVYDFDVIERAGTDVYFMVMAFVDGPTLRYRMEKKAELGERMTMAEIGVVMRGVCEGLAYAHERGMVHRDVTPGNILFNERGQAVLADFGIARIVSGVRLTQSGTTSGTPIYMAPEQGVGEAGDHRSDIYSVGVILFEMLTGQTPYTGDSAFAILLKHVNDPIPSPLDLNPNTPRAMESIIFRALAKDPGERYDRIEDMLADFEAAAHAQGGATQVLRRTAAMPSSADAGGLRRWLPLASGLVALAALIIAIVALITLGGRPSGQTPTVAAATLTLAVPPRPTRPFAPSMTAGPLIFAQPFDSGEDQVNWPITEDDPAIYRNIEQGVYRIWLKLPATAMTTIFAEQYHLYGAGYRFEGDFTLTATDQPDSATGIVFRYRSDDQYYVFAVNGQGHISVWLRLNGAWTELRGQPTAWTPNEAALPAGQTNHLRVEDGIGRLRCYVNEELVIDLPFSPEIRSGAIGIYLATTGVPVAEPYAEVAIDNFESRTVPPPTRTSAPAVATAESTPVTF